MSDPVIQPTAAQCSLHIEDAVTPVRTDLEGCQGDLRDARAESMAKGAEAQTCQAQAAADALKITDLTEERDQYRSQKDAEFAAKEACQDRLSEAQSDLAKAQEQLAKLTLSGAKRLSLSVMTVEDTVDVEGLSAAVDETRVHASYANLWPRGLAGGIFAHYTSRTPQAPELAPGEALTLEQQQAYPGEESAFVAGGQISFSPTRLLAPGSDFEFLGIGAALGLRLSSSAEDSGSPLVPLVNIDLVGVNAGPLSFLIATQANLADVIEDESLDNNFAVGGGVAVNWGGAKAD